MLRRSGRKKCLICGRLAKKEDQLCDEDSITIFYLNDVIEHYLSADDGIVDSRIADMMKHMASLYLEDPFVGTLRNTGIDLINSFVLNPSTKGEELVEKIPFKKFNFRDNSFISLDLAMKIYTSSQILTFDGNLIKPGKLLKRMISMRKTGISLRDSQFELVIDEFWGVFACSLTLEVVRLKIKGEIHRIPRIAMGILGIISSTIKKELETDREIIDFEKVHRFQVIKALAKLSTESRRKRLLNKLLGLGINRSSYVLNDVKDDHYLYAPEVSRFAEFERDNLRSIDRSRN